MNAPLSPDEAVFCPDCRKTLELSSDTDEAGDWFVVSCNTVDCRCRGISRKVSRSKSDALFEFAAARAALSTPVPEEGLPRGTASAAEPKSEAWQWRSRFKGGTWDAWENGRFGRPVPDWLEVEEKLLPPPPITEPGAGAASALPSPLHSQGEDGRLAEEWAEFEDDNDLVMDGHRHIHYARAQEAFASAWPRGLDAAIMAGLAALAFPPQGEPVAWIVEHEFKKRNPSLIFGGGGKVCFHGYDAKEKAEDLYSRLVARGDCEWIKLVPLYTAEALAAERAGYERVSREVAEVREDRLRIARERNEALQAGARETTRAIEAEARADRAAEDERDRLYEVLLTAAATTGAPVSYAAQTIMAEQEGAMLPADRAALRARNILKETPHGER